MKTSIKVDGLLDLDLALKQMAEDLGVRSAKGAANRALKAAAEPVFDAMVAGAPPHIKASVDVGPRLTPRQAKLARMGGIDKSLLQMFVGVNYKLGRRGRTAHL